MVCHRYDFLVRLWNGLTIFSNFLNFIFTSGLITTPHVLYNHMTYVYSLFLCFILHNDHMAKRSRYRIMIFYRLRSTTLRTPLHPRFLLPPPHPYTHHRGPRNTDRSEGGSHPDAKYGEVVDPDCREEDYVRPRLEPATVGLVLPSIQSERPAERYYREPSPDQARFGCQ